VTRIIAFDTRDLRFPTSKFLEGSEAMNPFSAADES
jgi:hypothetical protein